MNRLLARFALVGALAAVVAALPQSRAAAAEYKTPGLIFGGVDTGVVIPLNALDRFTSVGGYIQPFVGYKFFQDKELQLNPAIVGSMQFLGLPECTSCVRFNANGNQLIDSNPTYALGYHVGPRVSVPWGPIEIYGDWQVGGLTGLSSSSAITDTSWGFNTGGGINYFLNENVALGAVGRWNRWYQRVHGVGDVRYAQAGLELFLQQSPPPPPPPPAPVAAPPPPPPPAKKKIVLRGVNFDFDKYNIRPDAVPILEQACSILKQEANINVQCQGHTDSIGTEAYNQRLSERRANAVREWLVKCGISPSRLSAKGFGEANPVASNATPGGRAQNRRTELLVVGQ
jgi:outer membrane protein OmpA-like peptidoglycan-associated protein